MYVHFVVCVDIKWVVWRSCFKVTKYCLGLYNIFYNMFDVVFCFVHVLQCAGSIMICEASFRDISRPPFQNDNSSSRTVNMERRRALMLLQASDGQLSSPLIGPRLPRPASDWLMARDISTRDRVAPPSPGSCLTPQHMCDALTTGTTGGGGPRIILSHHFLLQSEG